MSESHVSFGAEGAAPNDNSEEQQDIANEPGCSAQGEEKKKNTEQGAIKQRSGDSSQSTRSLKSRRGGLTVAMRLKMYGNCRIASAPEQSQGAVIIGTTINSTIIIGSGRSNSNNTTVLSSVESLEERKKKVKSTWDNAKETCQKTHQNQSLKQLEHLGPINMTLEDYHVDLEVITERVHIIKLEKIFDSEYKRTLIYGDAGYGKTTLLAKLAFDWHHRKPYIRRRFDLFLHFTLRTLETETTLFDTINQEMLNLTGKDFETVLNAVLEEYGQKILILIDGLDEAKNLEGILQELEKIKKSKYSLCAFVLTSRPQQLKDKGLEFVTKFVKIRGMSEENQKKCIELYFENFDNEPKKVVELIAKKLFKNDVSPLLLFIICFLGSEKQLEKYQKMVNYGKDIEDDLRDEVLDLMCSHLGQKCSARKELNLSEKDIEKILIRLGMLCLSSINTNKLQISASKIETMMRDDSVFAMECGLLYKVSQGETVEGENVFQPAHKLFFERLAEKYLLSLEGGEEVSDEQEIRILMEHCRVRRMFFGYFDFCPERENSSLVLLAEPLEEHLTISKRHFEFSFKEDQKKIKVYPDFDLKRDLQGRKMRDIQLQVSEERHVDFQFENLEFTGFNDFGFVNLPLQHYALKQYVKESETDQEPCRTFQLHFMNRVYFQISDFPLRSALSLLNSFSNVFHQLEHKEPEAVDKSIKETFCSIIADYPRSLELSQEPPNYSQTELLQEISSLENESLALLDEIRKSGVSFIVLRESDPIALKWRNECAIAMPREALKFRFFQSKDEDTTTDQWNAFLTLPITTSKKQKESRLLINQIEFLLNESKRLFRFYITFLEADLVFPFLPGVKDLTELPSIRSFVFRITCIEEDVQYWSVFLEKFFVHYFGYRPSTEDETDPVKRMIKRTYQAISSKTDATKISDFLLKIGPETSPYFDITNKDSLEEVNSKLTSDYFYPLKFSFDIFISRR